MRKPASLAQPRPAYPVPTVPRGGLTEREFIVQAEMALSIAFAALEEPRGAFQELGVADAHDAILRSIGRLRTGLRQRFTATSADAEVPASVDEGSGA